MRWQDGVRNVDDGDVITTAGVLSGVDGALRVVERMLGPAAAPRFSGPAWPWALTLRPVLIAAAAVVGGLGIQLTIRRSSTGGDHATSHRP